MRRRVLQVVLLISLGVPLCVQAADARGLRQDRADQVVRTPGYRVHAPARHIRRAYRPASRHAERARPAHRRVVRHRSRPAVATDRPAQAVYYYDNTLVGRDPDANVRLMLLRDNVRTMWAR